MTLTRCSIYLSGPEIASFPYRVFITTSLRFTVLISVKIVTFPHERMHMDVVLLTASWSVLLTFFHGLTQVRMHFEVTQPDKPWLLALEESKVSFVHRWGTMCVTAAQVSPLSFYQD